MPPREQSTRPDRAGEQEDGEGDEDAGVAAEQVVGARGSAGTGSSAARPRGVPGDAARGEDEEGERADLGTRRALRSRRSGEADARASAASATTMPALENLCRRKRRAISVTTASLAGRAPRARPRSAPRDRDVGEREGLDGRARRRRRRARQTQRRLRAGLGRDARRRERRTRRRLEPVRGTRTKARRRDAASPRRVSVARQLARAR